MITININTNAVVAYSNKLEKMRKSDLPLAVRGTLNRVAFNVKQETMPSSASKNFEKRKPNFFKANSKVVMAKGFNVNTMHSTVGFMHTNAQYNNYAVTELEEQEHGGGITHRTFVPTKMARTSQDKSKMVRPNNRLRNIRKIVDIKDVKGSSRAQRFIRAAILAGKGGFVIAGRRKSMLYRINSVNTIDGRTKVEQTPLYSVEQGRTVKIKPTKFMREATLQSASRLEKYYIEEARRRFEKMMK